MEYTVEECNAAIKEYDEYVKSLEPDSEGGDVIYDGNRLQAQAMMDRLFKIRDMRWDCPEIREEIIATTAKKLSRAYSAAYALRLSLADMDGDEYEFLYAKANGELPDLDVEDFESKIEKDESREEYGAKLLQALHTDGAEVIVLDAVKHTASAYIIRAGKMICISCYNVHDSDAPIMYRDEVICVTTGHTVSAKPARLCRFKKWNPLGLTDVRKPVEDEAETIDSLARDIVDAVELHDGDDRIMYDGDEVPGGIITLVRAICAGEKMRGF